MATKIHQLHRDRPNGPITRVRMSTNDGPIVDTLKVQLIEAIRAGEVVETASKKGEPALVAVEGNPPRLRTHSDGTEANNLGGLPEY